MLNKEIFLKIVESTPLISIDLIIPDEFGRILLGRRNNKPAQGYWFVPGGRVLKDERLDAAFERLVEVELGISAQSRSEAAFHGAYEHLYDDNFAGAANVTTHYVVLGYRLQPFEKILDLPVAQHAEYRWVSIADLLADSDVHENTKAYFR